MNFDPVKFRAYLEARRADLFRTNSGCFCPLAKWLAYEHDPTRLRRIDVNFHSTTLNDSVYRTPIWMTEFMRLFDMPDEQNEVVPDHRTGADALEALDHVEGKL